MVQTSNGKSPLKNKNIKTILPASSNGTKNPNQTFNSNSTNTMKTNKLNETTNNTSSSLECKKHIYVPETYQVIARSVICPFTPSDSHTSVQMGRDAEFDNAI